MSKAAMNLQDSFLNQVRRENSEVRILLVNGTLLRGTVKGFDNFTLILNNRNGQHLVYKHAIAQIVTHRPHVKTDEIHPDQSEDKVDETEGGTTTDKPEKQSTPSGRHENSPSETSNRPPKNRKEGFNKLDLSQVKLGSGESSK